MFLNTKIVNKLIKEAFKTGLVVAATEESMQSLNYIDAAEAKKYQTGKDKEDAE